MQILLSADHTDPPRNGVNLDHAHGGCADGPDCGHETTFSTWSYETDERLSLVALRESARKLPANVYRCKGILHSSDAPGRRSILQVVGKRIDLAYERDWGDQTPRTRIVCIGAYGAMDDAVLRDIFNRCIAARA